MALTEAQKQKIKEEEKYRAEIKRELKEEEKQSRKGHGCLWWLGVLFIGIPLIIAVFPLTLGVLAAKFVQGLDIDKRLRTGIAATALISGLFLTLRIYYNVPNTPKSVRVNKSENTVRVIRDELGQRIRNRYSSQGERYIIQGQEIRVGEAWDSVAEKLGKTAIKTKVAQDPEFGQIVEHQYEKYSILVAREPEEQLYYIVWDIYPNSK